MTDATGHASEAVTEDHGFFSDPVTSVDIFTDSSCIFLHNLAGVARCLIYTDDCAWMVEGCDR